MHTRRWLVLLQANLLFLTLAAHVMLHAMVPGLATSGWSKSNVSPTGLATWFAWHHGSPQFAALFEDSLLCGETALLTAWFILGPGPWFVRANVAGVFALLLMHRVAQPEVIMNRNGNLILGPAITEVAILAIGFGILKRAGYAIERAELASPRHPWQFSLKSLFLAITASALAVLLGQALRTYAPPHGTVPTWLAMGSAALPVAIASAMAIGGVLLPSPPWWLAGLGLVPALGLIPPCLCARETEVGVFVGWAVLQTLVVVFTTLVVRSCGYRLLLRRSSIPK